MSTSHVFVFGSKDPRWPHCAKNRMLMSFACLACLVKRPMIGLNWSPQPIAFSSNCMLTSVRAHVCGVCSRTVSLFQKFWQCISSDFTMGKCAFKYEWLKNDNYKAWVPNNRHEAACSYCGGKSFSVAFMGESRLREHGNA